MDKHVPKLGIYTTCQSGKEIESTIIDFVLSLFRMIFKIDFTEYQSNIAK